MPDEFDEVALREKARAAIQSGTLPARLADRRYGGAGTGAFCAVCGAPVTREQPEIEIEFNRQGVTPGLDRYHLHRRCLAAWEIERTKIEGTSK
jgi:hypothetical protein